MPEGEPQEFDVVVLGGGPGGYAAALYGANAGLSFAVVDRDKVGGTCLHRGCIPAKEFLETASVYRTVAGAKEFGVQAEQPSVDFAVSQARKQKVVDSLWKGLSGLMRSRKIQFFEDSTARFDADGVVRIVDGPAAGTELRGRHTVLAAGSVPRTIPGFDVDGTTVITSDELLALEALPASAVVIGGGAIGCEFASMMSDLGTQVTILEALPKILPGCDSDVANVVERAFKRRGIDIKTGVEVRGHSPGVLGTTVHYGQDQTLAVDTVVVSVGRRARSEGLLGEGTGIELDQRGFVPVDGRMRTVRSGVYAVGDLVSVPDIVHPQLAHVGFAEGIVVVKDILGEPVVPVDYGRVPWCIYSHPEVAFAGMTEQAAKDAGYDVVSKRMPGGHNGRNVILGEADAAVKVVARKDADGRAGQVLGVHMVGPWVTEQLGQGYLSVNWEATVDEVAQFVQPHPTLSETFGEAMLALTGRGLHA